MHDNKRDPKDMKLCRDTVDAMIRDDIVEMRKLIHTTMQKKVNDELDKRKKMIAQKLLTTSK